LKHRDSPWSNQGSPWMLGAVPIVPRIGRGHFSVVKSHIRIIKPHSAAMVTNFGEKMLHLDL
jgi:hypothetical protein